MTREESSLRRQWLVLRALCSRHYGIAVRETAAELGVNEKTIRRDLDTFRAVGFPLEETVGDFGRKTWRIKATANLPPLCFSFEEAVSLYVGRQLLESLAGTGFREAAEGAFQKLRTAFSPNALNYLERFAGFFHYATTGVSNYEAKAELIDALKIAVEESKTTHLLYQSEHATEPAFRDVDPYGLILYNCWLYLVAFDPQEDKIKHYKVDRVEAVEMSRFPFRRPEGFSLAAHLSSTFGVYQVDGEPITCKVRFAPSAARYILESKTWPGCHELAKQRDGSVLAEFRLSCTTELKSWLMSFGAKALVLEPESLRREITEELGALLALYSSSSDRDESADHRNPFVAESPLQGSHRRK